MELVEAKRPGPKNSRKPTIITWGDESGEKKDVKYLFIRGSVVWPKESYPGIVLMAGQELESKKLIIFEEFEFTSLSQAADAFNRFWAYLPHLYYYNDIPENDGFCNHLYGKEKLAGKLPFIAAPHADSEDYGNNLIREFLSKGLLVVPQEGVLVNQLQEARKDLDPGELYAVRALRYLLTGIDHNPWPFEVTDINLLKCAV